LLWTTCRRRNTISAVPQPLPRAFRRQLAAEDSAKVERIVREAEGAAVDSVAGVTAGGDSARLRGVPAIGRGVSGAIRGTNPVAELLRRHS
jgi:hypothetical protein